MSEAVHYGFRAELDVPFDIALERATATLKEEGFGVVIEALGQG